MSVDSERFWRYFIVRMYVNVSIGQKLKLGHSFGCESIFHSQVRKFEE